LNPSSPCAIMQLHLVDDRLLLPKTLYLLVLSSSTRCFFFFDGESGNRRVMPYKSFGTW
jgi:hypothetical protein